MYINMNENWVENQCQIISSPPNHIQPLPLSSTSSLQVELKMNVIFVNFLETTKFSCSLSLSMCTTAPAALISHHEYLVSRAYMPEVGWICSRKYGRENAVIWMITTICRMNKCIINSPCLINLKKKLILKLWIQHENFEFLERRYGWDSKGHYDLSLPPSAVGLPKRWHRIIQNLG